LAGAAETGREVCYTSPVNVRRGFRFRRGGRARPPFFFAGKDAGVCARNARQTGRREDGVVANTDQLWSLCEDYLDGVGLELDDLEVAGDGPRLVKVTVDGEAGRRGVDVDRLSGVSQALSRLLDERDMFQNSYTLEVTSPGLERKLRRPRHYEKSVGSDVKISTTCEVGGQTHHRGVLEAAEPDGFVIRVGSESRRIAYAQVAVARTVFEWKKPAKPGQKR